MGLDFEELDLDNFIDQFIAERTKALNGYHPVVDEDLSRKYGKKIKIVYILGCRVICEDDPFNIVDYEVLYDIRCKIENWFAEEGLNEVVLRKSKSNPAYLDHKYYDNLLGWEIFYR